MKMVLILSLSLSVSFSCASSNYELKKEANDALYNISKCANEMPQILTSGAWIGKTQYWDSRNKNYGYNFHVFNTDWSDFSTYKVGELRLVATYIPNPPADASSYKYTCTIKLN